MFMVIHIGVKNGRHLMRNGRQSSSTEQTRNTVQFGYFSHVSAIADNQETCHLLRLGTHRPRQPKVAVTVGYTELRTRVMELRTPKERGDAAAHRILEINKVKHPMQVERVPAVYPIASSASSPRSSAKTANIFSMDRCAS
jgi:hypothetical protein